MTEPRYRTQALPGAIERPEVEVFSAYAVALGGRDHEPEGPSREFLAGICAAAEWVFSGGRLDPPMSPSKRDATNRALRMEFVIADDTVTGGKYARRGISQPWADGVRRMLAYALGLTDDQPAQLTASAAEAILAKRNRQVA